MPSVDILVRIMICGRSRWRSGILATRFSIGFPGTKSWSPGSNMRSSVR